MAGMRRESAALERRRRLELETQLARECDKLVDSIGRILADVASNKDGVCYRFEHYMHYETHGEDIKPTWRARAVFLCPATNQIESVVLAFGLTEKAIANEMEQCIGALREAYDAESR